MKKIIYSTLTVFSMLMLFAFPSSALFTAGRVQTQGGNLNLRSGPSLESKVVGSVKNKSWLTVREKSGSWFLVEYEKGREAYVSEKYITHYPSSVDGTVKISSGYLNVRSSPDPTATVTDRLYRGDRVVVVKSNATWCGIVYQGNKTGYVAKAYLERTKESPERISLSVPSFSQTDARWKNYPIGKEGGTIGTIGCTTTALAMTESFHRGYTVTPPEMAKELSYSASGSLYWPAYYSVNNSSAEWLSDVLSVLKKGKPVVVGLKTTSGRQHWVTVYGYEGTGQPKAADFSVRDPGSQKRSTLAAVMADYPLAYRFVYRK